MRSALGHRAQSSSVDSFGVGFADGYLNLIDAVGNPVAVNPDRELRRIARERGWPVLEFSGRAYPHARRRISPAFAAAGALGAAGIAMRLRGR